MGINKDRHARIIIMRPETILHSEAGYIFADCSRPTRFFLQFGGGPYILRQLARAQLERRGPDARESQRTWKNRSSTRKMFHFFRRDLVRRTRSLAAESILGRWMPVWVGASSR